MPQDDSKHLITITDPTEDRYSSLRLIDWWRQERISSAHVMVVGAGALGNEVLKNLALLGIGHIFIVDFDHIEAANLTRSVLFRPEDGGSSKAEVAAARVRALNSDLQVIAFNGDVTLELGLGVYRRMDVIIGCLDNRAARMAVNTACWNVQTPWIDGALDVFDGLVQVFYPPDSSCYECTMSSQDYTLLHTRYSCPPGFTLQEGRQPTLPTTASIIAAMQVQEAIKVLHHQPVQGGETVYYSGATMRLSHIVHPRREDCPGHNVYTSIVSLPHRAQDLTLAQFISLARLHMQTEGVIYLPQSVVTTFYCKFCNAKEDAYQPYERVIPTAIPCPRCDNPRTFAYSARAWAR
jgi:molybdopterin/thiamine biosynthesis adenylyltransferase